MKVSIMDNVIQVSMESLIVGNTIKSRVLKPDKDGLYETPMIVYNEPSRNRTLYDFESAKKEYVGPSLFNTMLINGQLYGEADHPSIHEFSTNDPDYVKAIMARLGSVKHDRKSHRIESFRFENLESGGVLVYGKYKPCLPLGAGLQEALDDPRANPSFSLRAFTDKYIDTTGKYAKYPDMDLKKTTKMLAVDWVSTGGFATACKANAVSTEAIQIDLSVTKLNQLVLDGFCTESLSNTELNDILKSKNVERKKRVISFIDDPDQRIRKLHGTKAFESLAMSLL